MVTTYVQQVTTRSKAKQSEWDIQEEVRKVGKEWVEEANSNNVSRTLRENITLIVTTDKFDNQQVDPSTTTDAEDDEFWKALADSKISLSLSIILKLVPHFIDKVTRIIVKNKTEEVAVNFTNPTQGPTVMDEHSPSSKVVIKAQQVSGNIVNGGSVVNVITKITCDRLDIK